MREAKGQKVLRIQNVWCSNLGRETGYLDIFRVFFSLFMQMPQQYHKLGPDRYLLQPARFPSLYGRNPNRCAAKFRNRTEFILK
jgi:hypothetical protein